MNSPRREALLALVDVIEDGAYANLRLKEIDRGDIDLPYISSLVYTTLEHLKWSDYMLAHYVKPQKRLVRNILRMAMAEIFFMDTPDYAAVNGAVELAKECGKSASAGLVNGVLRHVLRERDCLPPLPGNPTERLSIQFSCPEWVIREWVSRFGVSDTEKLLERDMPAMEIRPQFPFTAEELARQISVPFQRGKVDDQCFRLERSIPLASLSLFREGKIAVQGEGSMAICRFLGDVSGKRVLDACAAPGGKSAYLWSLTRGNVDLTCYELHPHRVELMQRTFARLFVKANCETRDVSRLPVDVVPQFDAVLLDAPCSGLGLIREKPDVGLHRTEASIAELCATQAALLDSCSRLVVPGGTLCYSTCTISLRENERQVESFLNTHSDYTLDAQRQLLPQREGTGGFFMARMTRCI